MVGGHENAKKHRADAKTTYAIKTGFDVLTRSKVAAQLRRFLAACVTGSLPVATRRWFEIVGVRPKSARAANQFVLCQLVTLGVYDYWQKFGVFTIENFAKKKYANGSFTLTHE